MNPCQVDVKVMETLRDRCLADFDPIVFTDNFDPNGVNGGVTREMCRFVYIWLSFFFIFFFSFRLLSVLRGHSIFSSPPQRQMTSDFEGFSIPDFIHYIYFLILILEKEPVFSLLNVQC